jgi:large subunit ribosomal protein L23
MSKKITPKANRTEQKRESSDIGKNTITAEQASRIILAPYVTEKTFNQIEKENKLAFIVTERATKKEIIEAISILYEADIAEVNTTRTIRGKKAFVKFKASEGARDLATKLALV